MYKRDWAGVLGFREIAQHSPTRHVRASHQDSKKASRPERARDAATCQVQGAPECHVLRPEAGYASYSLKWAQLLDILQFRRSSPLQNRWYWPKQVSRSLQLGECEGLEQLVEANVWYHWLHCRRSLFMLLLLGSRPTQGQQLRDHMLGDGPGLCVADHSKARPSTPWPSQPEVW